MTKTLVFVVAAPTKVGRAKVGKNLGDALKQQGHRVTYFDYDREPVLHQLWPRALRTRQWPRALTDRKWRQRYLDHVNAKVLDAVRGARFAGPFAFGRA